jgi:hypothetical protein
MGRRNRKSRYCILNSYIRPAYATSVSIGYAPTGLAIGRENPISRPEADPILCLPIGIGHEKLKQGGKPDALSRRLDYTSGNDDATHTMTFLKSTQVDTHMLPEGDNVIAFSLNNAVINSVVCNLDDDLIHSIREYLPEDPTVSNLLPYLQDPAPGLAISQVGSTIRLWPTQSRYFRDPNSPCPILSQLMSGSSQVLPDPGLIWERFWPRPIRI